MIGVVLMGGRSRRMGRDKATLVVNGEALGARSLRALSGAECDEVMAVGGDHDAGVELVEPFAALWRPDLRPGAGPAAAIADLLSVGDGGLTELVVLSCDLPTVTAAAVSDLIDAAARTPGADAVVASIDGRPQYPNGVWRRVNHVAANSPFSALVAGRMVQPVELGEQWRDADRLLDLAGADIVWPGGTVIPEIDIDTFADQLAAGGATIDVREADEYTEAHVPGAQLVPLSEFADRIDELPSGPLLVICKSGGRSMKACEFLESTGRTDATNVAGGTMAWITSGRATVSGPERG